ncbi:MAG: TrbC/VirB2 family protein [Gammaproteobacteria bacterium]
MKKMIQAYCWLLAFLYTTPVLAALPSFASGGDITGDLESKGQTIVDTVTLISAIAGVIAIAGSGVYFSGGNSEKGKQFLVGGLIGIFVAGAVYSIAGLVG